MKALVLTEYNKLEVQNLPKPKVGADEVLIRIKAVGICGSDIHGLDGSTGRRVPPLIMGHELSGEIAEVGEQSKLTVGDRVTVHPTIFCGECDPCLKEQYNICHHRKILGVSCPEYRLDGGMAEYLLVPSRVVYPIPEGLSFEEASLIEPTSVAVHAATHANLKKGEKVLVIGAGTIGLLLLQALKAKEDVEVTIIDKIENRLTLAKKLGADQTCEWIGQDTYNKLSEGLEGEKFDHIFEVVGLAETINMAVELIKNKGQIVLVGNISPNVSIPLQTIISKEINLQGTYALSNEIPKSLELIRTGKIDVKSLISATPSLDEASLWFKKLTTEGAKHMKVILKP